MNRLSEATLDRLPSFVRRPAPRPAPRVVHLGIGAFHRAHQAVVFDDLGWGVTGASLRSPAVRKAMVPQDCLYSLVVGEEVRVIGAVRDVLLASDALTEALAAPETDIVTLTVTEKGYLPDPSGKGAADFLAAALKLRHARGIAPFTAISCDNLPENGRRLREAVLAASDPDTADWIAREGAFPQTMVDRIVPATEEADIDALAARTGLVDRAMVKAEPFLQWVIEDRFAGPRPDFAAAGVQLTAEIAPWEDAKLRLLNGAHSAIAYLGALAGLDFVHEVIAVPAYARFVAALWDEVDATLSPPPGLDIAAYRRALMARFANPGLQHRTRQIAMDGSQKLPQRLLAPIAARLERDQPIAALALAVAGWMRWQSGRTDAGEAFIVDDPLAAEMARRIAGLSNPAEQAKALIGIDAIFPPRLAADPRFAEAVARQLARLATLGARRTIEEFRP
ncbi:mannitol dehydrogenase family protein [Sphingosinicella sp. LHD-64]|uniref:mannitol dehydrogenase family protein n=1 Tax=Sphingosinicella sp. LHD-64 TaxID=3072139 RepID=UPI00280F530E|nr:mannitol dehydrogenase family protein [Sphingosinicella sp. LHD-64]MDQ8758105.1 mannitol dehydrogenase family protein [Sphingosinicella sp. LHD-64]